MGMRSISYDRISNGLRTSKQVDIWGKPPAQYTLSKIIGELRDVKKRDVDTKT
jgi:hypothetical protein